MPTGHSRDVAPSLSPSPSPQAEIARLTARLANEVRLHKAALVALRQWQDLAGQGIQTEITLRTEIARLQAKIQTSVGRG